VALPLDILEIEMSPGAFRTLVEFCRMANCDGICWPSLEQLGQRLSRSRAALSGYIAELRALSLVETETQRTANGFNYRLRYRVTFWSTWKARFARRSAGPNPERRVQPAERLEKQNQIQKNQPAEQRSAGAPEAVEIHREWLAHIAGAPYPTFTSEPPPGLIARTERCVQERIISADMGPALARFFEDRGVSLPGESLKKLVARADRISCVPDAPALLGDALRSAWRHNWKRPPSERFLDKLISRIAADHPAPLVARLLAGHLRRWQIHRKALRHAA
jgi:hypothetical protein